VNIVQRASEGLTSTKDNSALRARCLSSLYSALPVNSKTRYTVFKALVDYVGDKSPVTDNLDSDYVNELCATWAETSAESIRALHLSIADALKTSSPAKSQQALLAYLSTFQSAQDAQLADIKRIKECAVNAIRDPVSSSKDASLLSLGAILRLRKEDSLLFDLMSIVCGDSLDKYAEFCTAHPGFGKEYGIDQEKTFERMRLLALAALGSDNDRALSYQEVGKALRIDAKDVESWIIRAIAAGVVDAKIDQVNESVVIHRASQRAFNDEQWVRLSTQLKKWRASVRSVLQTVQNARDQHAAAMNKTA
jgi:translation initiation factor 3 subunit M